MKIKATIAAIITLACAIPAHAADTYTDLMLVQHIIPALSQNGFEIVDIAETELLGDGEYQTFTISPRRGDEVTLVAIGDADSYDVDMFISGGESGRDIDLDVYDDDMPVCRFVSRGGTYKVTIRIVETRLPANVVLVYATR